MGVVCWSVWPSLSCLGLELAAARELALWLIRLIGGAWNVAFVVALEYHRHRGAKPGPGPGRAYADELLGQSSLLSAARGGCDRRRLGGATDANQTAVREKEGSVWVVEMNGVDGGGCSRGGSCGGRPVLGRGVYERSGSGRWR